jgi:uncharacterized protein (TIGR00369 family)
MRPTQTDIEAALARIPYASFLNLRAELRGDELTLLLPYNASLIGNPALPALHGGAVGAFMELAAVTQISVAQRHGAFPKTIDINIDYLRPGRPLETYARAKITKLGRRIAHAQVEAWQLDRADPIASLRGHFLVGARAGDAGGA